MHNTSSVGFSMHALVCIPECYFLSFASYMCRHWGIGMPGNGEANRSLDVAGMTWHVNGAAAVGGGKEDIVLVLGLQL